MIVVVDGDNSPGSNVNGIKRMKESDSAFIYYASDNKYYQKKENRATIENDSICSIKFKEISAGNCAVDLAVAMDLSEICSKAAGSPVVLISNDKHFGIITKLASSKFERCSIFQASSIKDALKKYRILEVSDLVELNNWLIYTFGSETGTRLYRKIDDIFAIKHTCMKAVSDRDASDCEGCVQWKAESKEKKKKSLLRSIWKKPERILKDWFKTVR